MTGTMKAVRPSYLHLPNFLSGRVGFSDRVVGFSFKPNPSSRVQLLNPTRSESKKIPTRPDAVSLFIFEIEG